VFFVGVKMVEPTFSTMFWGSEDDVVGVEEYFL